MNRLRHTRRNCSETVRKPEPYDETIDYKDLLTNNVLSSGIRIHTDTGHAIDEKWAYSFYEETISDLMIRGSCETPVRIRGRG